VEEFDGKSKRGSPDGWGKPTNWWKSIDQQCTAESYDAARIARTCRLAERVAAARGGALVWQPAAT
jgi:hypothetical protein